ncbi:MAG: hypothetical protein DYG88_05190 [Chloroflexi bacterium CFX4]|nr:hypothetical protein [Chloroflexi bacterium CFX4]MDL1924027.1 hypothetical protein [Chloroflexi bacterium CFX3]
MFYEIHQLTEQLLYIRWIAQAQPNCHPEGEYIADLRHRFDTATQPLYIVSDLRHGKITNVRILQQLGKLTFHPNFGGGTAFTENFTTTIYVSIFARFSAEAKRENDIFSSLSEALAHLESLKAGVTEGVDWEAFAQSLTDPA